MDEGEVDDAVRTLGGRPQAVGIFEVAARTSAPRAANRLRGLIGTRETHNFVTHLEELGHHS